MLYINQQDYPMIPYPTNADDPSSSSYIKGTVASSGCGLCCLCMVVDRLTLKELTLQEAIRLSIEHQANRKVGTNLKILGQVVADLYGLHMSTSNDTEDVKAVLRNGGCCVMNVGGDHDDHIGTFSDVGHYVLIQSFSEKGFCVMDPAYRPDKYTIPGRKGKVREDGLFLYTDAKVLQEDTLNRDPGFYLFTRKGTDTLSE